MQGFVAFKLNMKMARELNAKVVTATGQHCFKLRRSAFTSWKQCLKSETMNVGLRRVVVFSVYLQPKALVNSTSVWQIL